ncbi:MAG TPA: DVUA0089 family protein [Bryobacteraceae bacterium]|jgi:hypothetical protein|nr:DVUA0089 family protein [Bryobacteraceae bacterium]
MYKPICLLALLPLFSFASSVAFSGAFTQDDNMLEYEFTIAATSTVTLESFGYAGGTAGSTSVPAGGFAPVLSVFGAGSSGALTLLGFDDGGTAPSACDPRSVDPVSHLCLDPYLVMTSQNPGTYLVVLTENDNTPNGPDFAGGFNEQGNGNFTGGPFIDPFGNQRNGNFYFTISGADSAAALPEPSTVSLLIAGLGLLSFKRKLQLSR